MLDARDHRTGRVGLKMPDNNSISIKVVGLDRILKALDKFPRQIGIYIGKAGGEAANRVILPTEGLQKYPPAGPWNQPPTPYYYRGRGTQYKNRNSGSSERYGTQWRTDRDLQNLTTAIGNRASYAQYLAGEDQVSWAQSHGWKKLYSTAVEKIDKITKVYQAWVDKLIKDLGL